MICVRQVCKDHDITLEGERTLRYQGRWFDVPRGVDSPQGFNADVAEALYTACTWAVFAGETFREYHAQLDASDPATLEPRFREWSQMAAARDRLKAFLGDNLYDLAMDADL